MIGLRTPPHQYRQSGARDDDDRGSHHKLEVLSRIDMKRGQISQTVCYLAMCKLFSLQVGSIVYQPSVSSKPQKRTPAVEDET